MVIESKMIIVESTYKRINKNNIGEAGVKDLKPLATRHQLGGLCAPATQKGEDRMTVNGMDYSMEKARIEASGYDMLSAIPRHCQLCGRLVDEHSILDGIVVCKDCEREA